MKMKRRECLGIIVLLNLSLWFLGSFFPGTTFAAPVDFPKKEITVIVAMAPAGGIDILARGVGKTMSKYLGVPVVVMNLPGAAGARGLLDLYQSAPDGYTIGVVWGAAVIDQVFEKRGYDNNKYTFIGKAQSSPSFVIVKSDSPLRSVKDFKTFGKPVRTSTHSLTSTSTVASMVIANRDGFPLVVVGGYQAAPAAILAVIRGEVEFYTPVASAAAPFVQAGQIRPILTIGHKRSPTFPDIPTVGELGYPDLGIFGMDLWFVAPPETPKARIQILEDALMKTLKDPEYIEWAKGAGVDISPLSGEETKKMVFNMFGVIEQYKADIEKYIKK